MKDAAAKPAITTAPREDLYTLEGLQQDFPTADALIKFVYDQTGLSLNLRGRSPKLKYETALKALTNQEVDAIFIDQGHNPWVDQSDLIPEDPRPAQPPRQAGLPDPSSLVNQCSFGAPHPDPDRRSSNQLVTVHYRKYDNNVLTYEITGPVNRLQSGNRLDKYGRTRPERYIWDDPRTGECLMRSAAGEYSRAGENLRALLVKQGVWGIVDRSLVDTNTERVLNPWS